MNRYPKFFGGKFYGIPRAIDTDEIAIEAPNPPRAPPPLLSNAGFEQRQHRVGHNQPQMIQTNPHDNSRRPRFTALRVVATCYEVAAVVVAVLAVGSIAIELSAVLGNDGTRENTDVWAAALTTIGTTALSATLMITGLVFIAQTIRLGLQIEENTYRTQCIATIISFA